MNLTKANIKALRKVTVKIECSNNNKGSGIIVSVGENLYVLTAAHIIQKDTKDGPLDKRADRYFAQEEQPDIPLNCGRSGLLQQARRG